MCSKARKMALKQEAREAAGQVLKGDFGLRVARLMHKHPNEAAAVVFQIGYARGHTAGYEAGVQYLVELLKD